MVKTFEEYPPDVLFEQLPNPSDFDMDEAIQAGDFYNKGIQLVLHVQDSSDLNRLILKSDSCSIEIPELEIEIPEGTARVCTVHDYLEQVKSNMDMAFSSESLRTPAQNKVLNNVELALQGQWPFDLILRDVLGNSRIQGVVQEKDAQLTEQVTGLELYRLDPKIEYHLFDRSARDNIELGMENDNPLFQSVTGEEGMKLAIELIQKSNKIVGFTGAGISTESNIPAFRNNKDGGKENTIWSEYDVNELVYSNIIANVKARTSYFKMHAMLHQLIQKADPNASHRLFVELEKQGKLLGVITQNIDGLHQRSGVSEEKVMELHGTTLRVKCETCHKSASSDPYYDEINNMVAQAVDPQELTFSPLCDACSGILKPSTISFGQALDPDVLNGAQEATQQCDLMIVMGSALVVAPANQLPLNCVDRNVPVILINLGETPMDNMCTVLLKGRCGELCEQIIPQI